MRRPRTVAALLAAALLAAVLVAIRVWPPAPPEPARPGSDSGASARSSAPPPSPAPFRPDPPSRDGGETAPPARGALEGTVRSTGSARGVPGAELTFSRAGAAASVRSTLDGSFRFEPPEPGRWQLAAAAAPGHVPFAPEWGHSPVTFDARPGERVSGVAVWLRTGDRYVGEVQDPEGKPVEGADVRLLGSATGDRALLPSVEKAVSGPGGAFVIVAPEGATLEARHAGFAPGRATIDFSARASRRVAVKLGKAGAPEPLAAIAGRVTSGGEPVEGALVLARQLERGRPGSADDAVAAQTTSDAEGRFTLRPLDPGRYLLTAAREGFAQPRAAVARSGEEAAIELSRGGRIAGVVREASSGKPVALFRLLVLRGDRGWKLPIRTTTVVDASGHFEVADLPPGSVVLTVSAPGLVPSEEMEVAVAEPPGVSGLEIRLATGGRVSGRVTDRVSGQPLPGARIALEGDGGAPSVLDAGATAVSGRDGSFLLGGLPPRAVSLFVSADGHHARIVAGIEVRDGGLAGPVEVRLSPVSEGEDPRLELAGIGATLERRGRSALRITAVLPGGGALEAGLAPGDEILSVEGRPISELGFAGAVDLIRGPEDTRVRLVMKRGDAPAAEVWVWRRLVRA